MRHMFELKQPHPTQAQTLVVDYVDGRQLKMPYMDRISAVRFLLAQENVTHFDVIPFDQECWVNYNLIEDCA